VVGTDRRVRIRIGNDLLVVNLCSIILIVVISLIDIEALRIALGLPFLLFFPGYTLIAALFPEKSALGTVQRIALSLGFSIVVTPLLGLMLNMVWAIRLHPILVSIALFVAAMSVVAWYRRRRVEQDDSPDMVIDLPLGSKGHPGLLDAGISIVLALALLGAIVAMVHFVANPKVGERFTEFYVVGAEDWPEEIAVGEEAAIVLGIANRERETMVYAVEVLAGGSRVALVGPTELDHGETPEDRISFVPEEACARTRLAQDVNVPYGPILAQVKIIQVASVRGLGPGDHILIGQEAAEIEETQGSTIILKQVLHEYHPAGAEVIEVQKVEFRLHKIWRLGEPAEAELSVWVGKQSLATSVTNQGRSEAEYRIEARIEGAPGDQPRVESAGPAEVAVGDVWTNEIAFSFSEMHQSEFSLYNHGELLFRRWESASYPSLYLWVHVTDGNAGS
jgi:uncharacterized membrane protein